jgi:hypothetical protein
MMRPQHSHALAAGGDASLWQRLRAKLAPKRPQDAAVEQEFRRIRGELPRFQELPPYFAWDTLASDMKANILLGLEAGEAVRPRRLHPPIGWRAGLAMAALSLLMISGYWWQMPHRWVKPALADQAVLQSAPGQLGVHQQQGGFTLVLPDQSTSTTLSGASGALRADFVDSETGQLMVAHVYLDE